MPFDELTLRLINRYQHGMPVCAEPYRVMAETLGCSEEQLLQRLQRLADESVLSRIGPVFEHSRAGASTLVALAVPAERINAVASWISGLSAVNHNYLREHTYNLWFVLTAPDRHEINRLLAHIQQQTGLEPLDLPMLQAFHIDLGFPLEYGT